MDGMVVASLVLVCLLPSSIVCSWMPIKKSSESVIVRRMLKGYSEQEPPMKDRATEVKLGIYVNSFYSINEQTMDYSISMYLRQLWKDPRLAFESPDGKTKEVKLLEKQYDKLWKPDTFFRNEKEADYHAITVMNQLIRINASGFVRYTSKISATLSCPMKLHKYPLDTQICPMMFESFGYTMDTMYFAWLDSPIDIDAGLQLPQFFLVDKVMFDCSQNYTAGAFPCLSIQFILRRDIGYFLIQVYVPSILIVILSWVSFWINIDASPARVSLGLLTVLTTTTMSGGARESLPRVSYIKAIDVWMIICLVFVFASLIEYAVVNVAARHQVRPTVVSASAYRIPRTAGGGGSGPAGRGTAIRNNSASGGFATSRTRSVMERICDFLKIRSFMPGDADGGGGIVRAPFDPEGGKRRARGIDKLSRKCFPVAFIAFNIVYWVVYTRPADDTDHTEQNTN
jgi:cation transporter family protein